MHVIAVANSKGGVGKTTFTANLCVGLARSGLRVLAVDGDPQATLSRWMVGEEPELGLAQLVSEDYGSAQLVDDLVIPTRQDKLSLLPAGIGLDGAYSKLQGLEIYRLQEALDDLQGEFDVVVIDFPPRVGAVAETLLVASDSIIHPLDSGSESFVALQKLSSTIARVQKHKPALSVLGVVITDFEDHATSRAMENAIDPLFGTLRLRMTIPHSAYFKQAQARGETIFVTAERNRQAAHLATAYETAIKSVTEAIGL